MKKMSKNNLSQPIINLIIQRPICFYPSGWNDCVPKWIIELIKKERLENFKNYPTVIKEEASDAEIAAYLFTACLSNPIDSDAGELYTHLVCDLVVKHQKGNKSDFKNIGYNPILSSGAQQIYERIKKDIFYSIKRRIDEGMRYVAKTQKGGILCKK